MNSCKFNHEGICCNCGSPQFKKKCKTSCCECSLPMTNYERIRNMSVEEMAVFLNYNISQDKYMNTVIRNLDDLNIKRTICFNLKDMREWLESDVEGGDGE